MIYRKLDDFFTQCFYYSLLEQTEFSAPIHLSLHLPLSFRLLWMTTNYYNLRILKEPGVRQ